MAESVGHRLLCQQKPLRKEVKGLQKGMIKDDTSYVYALPYENNTSHLLVQGYFSHFFS
jgi:hypothetical protein